MEKYIYDYERNKLKGYLGDDLVQHLKNHNAIVAGGTVTSIFTNSEINDIDLYFKSKEELAEFLIETMDSKYILAKTDKAVLFMWEEIKVQAIYFDYFENAVEIFKTFDYTVCMGAFDFSKDEFILHENFLKHNSQRVLKFNSNTAYPIISALRIDKYKNKGYSISKPEFIRVMLTVLSYEITDYETLKEQMGGMYGENYDDLLQSKEDEKFDIVTIIDKLSELQATNYTHKKAEPFELGNRSIREEVYKMLGIQLGENENKKEVWNLPF